MSYILQALKKAEAERGLGRVPGLETPAPLTTAPGSLPARWWPWLVLACLAVAALAAALWWWLAASPVQAVPARPATSVMPVEPVQVSPPAAASPLPVLRPPPPPVNPAVIAPAPAPAAAQAPPPPVLAASQPTAKPAPAPPLQPWPTSPGWPNLSVSGSVYADEPAQRLLIVNGQVLREGDAASADLTLVSIGPKSAVLRYKGATYLWRY